MSLFKVIVELFPIPKEEDYGRAFLNEDKDDHAELIQHLENTIGIYAFYNSELEIIYLGKTKKNLWSEMKNAYSRDMPHYQRLIVEYPREKFKQTVSGLARKLVRRNLAVWEAACYFSAYSVNEDHIDELESLLIRIAPNDVVNKRMEGNGSLEMHYVKIED